MTRQETFDTVVNHLRKQNQKAMTFDSVDQRDKCRYRAPGGLKCAVGCLIPDDRYTEEFEGKAVTSYIHGGTNKITSLMIELGHDVRLLEKLQWLHDELVVGVWEDHFKRIAGSFDLVYTPKEGKLT